MHLRYDIADNRFKERNGKQKIKQKQVSITQYFVKTDGSPKKFAIVKIKKWNSLF